MLKRFASSGANVLVLFLAVIVFGGSFCALSALASAQRPESTTILIASTDLDIGHVITASDIVERMVFVDDNTALYIPNTEINDTIGGIVGTPIFAGQPIMRPAIIASASERYRLAAALNNYPGMTLFPLELSANNVLAPDATIFLPGDLVNLTAVLSARPSHPGEKMNTYSQFGNEASPAGGEEELKDTYPPMAKDIYPAGFRVMAIQGLPKPQVSDATTDPNAAPADDYSSTFSQTSDTKMLILLVPNDQREELALILQRSDKVFISLLARGDELATPGFTYWDFEKWFEQERSRNFFESNPTPTPTP